MNQQDKTASTIKQSKYSSTTTKSSEATKQTQNQSSFYQILQWPHDQLGQYFHDLINQHLEPDLFALIANNLDPIHQQMAVVKYSSIKTAKSQQLLNKLYQQSFAVIKNWDNNIYYPEKIQTNQILILMGDWNGKTSQYKTHLVLPFNLNYGFSLPIKTHNQNLKDKFIYQQTNQRVHALTNAILTWLAQPLLIHYQLNNPHSQILTLLNLAPTGYQIQSMHGQLSFDIQFNQAGLANYQHFYQKYQKQLPTCLNLNANKSKQQLHVILNDPIVDITAASKEKAKKTNKEHN